MPKLNTEDMKKIISNDYISSIKLFDPSGSSGTPPYLITSIGGDKFLLKGDIRPVKQIAANKIAKLLKIRVPKMDLISRSKIPPRIRRIIKLDELDKLMDYIEDLSDAEKKITKLIVMEFIEYAVDFSKNTRPYIEFNDKVCNEFSTEIGKIFIMDLYINNWDRFNILFSRNEEKLFESINYGEIGNTANILYQPFTNRLFSIDHTALGYNNGHTFAKKMFEIMFKARLGYHNTEKDIKLLEGFILGFMANLVDNYKFCRPDEIISGIQQGINSLIQNKDNIDRLMNSVNAKPLDIIFR